MLQLYAHKLVTNPSQEIMNSLITVLSIDKPNLQRRTLRVIKSIMATGNTINIPLDIMNKLKNTSDKELADIITDFYR